jgi:hypothetical protein
LLISLFASKALFACCLLHAGCLFGFLFNLMMQATCSSEMSTDYMALYPRKQNSSVKLLIYSSASFKIRGEAFEGKYSPQIIQRTCGSY